MNLRTLGSLAIGMSLLSACASSQQSSLPAAAAFLPQSSDAIRYAPLNAFRCYGTFGVEATPCPVKLNKSDGGSVIVSVTGPGVVYAAPIASDCVGPGSLCNIQQIASYPTHFRLWSVKGYNVCGTGWVVFVGVAASGTEVGTATVQVVNHYCAGPRT
jgi:hypothetical protein